MVCVEAEHDEIPGSDLRDKAELKRLGSAGVQERLVRIHSLPRDEDNTRFMFFPNLANCHR
ncbi:hypothetical protein XI07_15520 [Bradyrhizobium sp. CCBAU 11445]|nr:hypothetical protein [Bradyrhizobium sp. CCBAU 11445]